MKLTLSSLSALVLLGAGIVHADVSLYPWPSTAPVSPLYTVKVFDQCGLFEPKTLYSIPNLLPGPDGTGVTGSLIDRSMSYTPFSFTGEVEIEVTKNYGTAATRVEISPQSYGIEPSYFDGKKARFKLKQGVNPSFVSVNFVAADNQDPGTNSAITVKHGLMIFGDKPETNIPDLTQPGVVTYTDATTRDQIENANVIYFPAGDYDFRKKFGLIDGQTGTDARLYFKKNGQTIYLAPGAFIRGSMTAKGFDNLKLLGRGVITGADFYWHYFQEPGSLKGKAAYLDFNGSDNSEFNGIYIVNPTHHTIPSGSNSTIKDIKIIGWASNHDGVRPSAGSTVDGVFIKTSDDLDYARNQHTFKNSVIWPMRNGAFGQLGWNNLGTGDTEYENIRFIHSEWDINANLKRNTGIIGSVLSQGVKLSNNKLTNIYGEWGTGMLANISIDYDSDQEVFANPSDPSVGWGEIKNFTFKNIIMENANRNSGGVALRNQIRGFEKDGLKATVHDINFINLVMGNTIVTNANKSNYFDIDPNTTYNINFSTEGNIYNITSSINYNGVSGVGGTLSPSGTVPTPEGMDRYIRIIPDAGKRVADVVIDGVSVGRRNNVTFPSISAHHTLSVSFEDAPGIDSFGSLPNCAAPTFAFRTPITGSTYAAGAKVYTMADGTSGNGYISKVEFFLNGKLFLTDTSRPFTAYTPALTEGSHTLSAIATDNKKATASASLTIKTPVTFSSNSSSSSSSIASSSSSLSTSSSSSSVTPSDLTNVSLQSLGCDQIKVSWVDNGATAYRVRRKLSTETTYPTNLGDVPAGIGFFLDSTNKIDNVQYDYQVRPIYKTTGQPDVLKNSNVPRINNSCSAL